MEETSLLTCLANYHLFIPVTAPAQMLQDFEMEARERREGRAFSNLSCYKTQKKRPQLCLLNNPAEFGEAGESGQEESKSSSELTETIDVIAFLNISYMIM